MSPTHHSGRTVLPVYTPAAPLSSSRSCSCSFLSRFLLRPCCSYNLPRDSLRSSSSRSRRDSLSSSPSQRSLSSVSSTNSAANSYSRSSLSSRSPCLGSCFLLSRFPSRLNSPRVLSSARVCSARPESPALHSSHSCRFRLAPSKSSSSSGSPLLWCSFPGHLSFFVRVSALSHQFSLELGDFLRLRRDRPSVFVHAHERVPSLRRLGRRRRRRRVAQRHCTRVVYSSFSFNERCFSSSSAPLRGASSRREMIFPEASGPFQQNWKRGERQMPGITQDMNSTL